MSELPSRLLWALKWCCLWLEEAPSFRTLSLSGLGLEVLAAAAFFSEFLDNNSLGREAGLDGWGAPPSHQTMNQTWYSWGRRAESSSLSSRISCTVSWGVPSSPSRILKAEKAFICLISFERDSRLVLLERLLLSAYSIHMETDGVRMIKMNFRGGRK